MFIMIIITMKKCVLYLFESQCTCTYSTKKMRITVFMTIIENDNFKYS